MSTTEINHNEKDKTLEITCKIFTDDFESALEKRFQKKADLSDSKIKTSMDSLVAQYIRAHLQIKTDNRAISFSYLGFEKESEAVYAYLQTDNVSSVKKVEVTDSILYDMYEDQINIIHVKVAGQRKSTKLDYPEKEAAFSW